MLVSISANAVFHYTEIRKLYHILKDNRFELTAVIGSVEEEHGDGYYFSTTRHRLGGYHLNKDKRGACLIRLNSTALNANHKMKSINYWGEAPNETVRSTHSEAEDRLTSNKPHVKNAKKFIEDITVLFPNRSMAGKNDLVILRHVISMCKKSGIDIRVYDNKQDYLVDNKSNALPLREFIQKADAPYKRRKAFVMDSEIKSLLYLFHKDSVKDLDKDAKAMYFEYLQYGMREWKFWSDKVNMIVASISRVDRKDDPAGRKYLDSLIRILRQNKWKTKDFARAMIDKWSAI